MTRHRLRDPSESCRHLEVAVHVLPMTALVLTVVIYPMVRCSRGKCIIINNRDFGGIFKTRHGSDVDVHRMKRLFSDLLFECDVYRNLKAKDMEEVLEAAAKSQENHDADCLVVILMSHGDKDVIYGTDIEKLRLYDKVYPLFNNENCPALQGKPKLFFVQACRGDNTDSGTYVEVQWLEEATVVEGAISADAISYKDPSSPTVTPKPRTASFSDMCIVYATIPGFVALKNEVTGSWLLSAVYNVFSKHACTMDLDALMRRVNKEVLARAAHDGAKVTPCTEMFAWTSQLFFNPGLCAKHGSEGAHLTCQAGPAAKRLCC
ncbi:caspase-2-like isoform X2 [Haemaphysalis longicornis]